MSFASVSQHLEKMGVTNETANDEQRRQALLTAFWQELPAGMAVLKELADKAHREDRTVIDLAAHPEDTIAQILRLTGHSVPRQLLEDEFEINLGSYNCHQAVAAPKNKRLEISLKTQIDMQNGNLASVDC